MREDLPFQPQLAMTAGGLEAMPGAAGVTGGPPAPDAHRFYLWLFAALVAHGAVLTGFISAKPRQIGDAGGLDGAISISLVTEADLRGDATVDDQAPGNPAPPPAPAITMPPPQPPATRAAEEAPPAEPPPQTEPAPQATPPEPVMKPAIAPDVPREILTEAGEGEPKPAQPAQKEPAPHKAAETLHESKPKHKPAEAQPSPKPAPAKTKETKTAKLDLAMPPAMQAAIPGSRGAGLERPAGITRSGENDMFARGVIRALQQTMPQLRDTRGRVKVRITLDKNGNLVSTQVLMPSNVAGLDQSVVFATRQTSFPLPPYKAVPADLIFVVTYIYK